MTKVLKANSAPRSHRLLGPLSITAKVCLAAAACTLISLIATGVAVGIYASGSARQNAQRGVNAAATAIAQEVSADLAQSFKVLEGVGTALEVSKAGSNPMPRAELDALLRRTLEHNPNWLATGSLWEPNALDGKDAEYVSKGPENDATGRFVSYWNRASGSIAVEPLVDYDKPGANDWYAIPKATGKKTLIEPYLYKVMGKDVLMTSLVQPVYANGKFVAVVTMDMLLEGLHKTLGTVEAVQGAQVGIVSTAGSYVTNADAAKVGKPASDLSAEALAAVKRAEPYEYVDRGRVRVIAPIVAVREADPWAVVVEYEEAAAQAPAVAMLRTIALIAAFCAAISVAVLVGGLLAVTRPVRRLAETMSRLASGESDLRVQLSVTGDDELGRIATAFNQFTGKLRSVFEDVRETSQAVSAAALQIANGNQDLSARTERQAGNLQGISSSMTELSQAVQSSALTAGQADQVSQEAAATAERTQNVMEGAIAAMADLGASSRRIAEITAVIDGIAFQTNILALNAAVEAARAGEQGRGFAVVAGEVRTLAQRAAGAARDIKQLVEDSVSRAEAGSRRISESAEALLALTNSVNRVTTLVNEMSASAGQQATGIATVETSIVQLDSMTQQNAALVEEASAASESLRHQAQRLTGTLAVFLNNAPAHERR